MVVDEQDPHLSSFVPLDSPTLHFLSIFLSDMMKITLTHLYIVYVTFCQDIVLFQSNYNFLLTATTNNNNNNNKNHFAHVL